MKSIRGISLIEILLVVAIAATIVAGAIMYYSQTLLGSKAAQTITLIESINKAGYEWLQLPDSNGSKSDFAGLSLNELIVHHLLPCENQSCSTNPWGGAVTVGPNAKNPKLMEITIKDISMQACSRLVENMQNIAPQNSQLDKQNYCETDATAGNALNYHVSL